MSGCSALFQLLFQSFLFSSGEGLAKFETLFREAWQTGDALLIFLSGVAEILIELVIYRKLKWGRSLLFVGLIALYGISLRRIGFESIPQMTAFIIGGFIVFSGWKYLYFEPEVKAYFKS